MVGDVEDQQGHDDDHDRLEYHDEELTDDVRQEDFDTRHACEEEKGNRKSCKEKNLQKEKKKKLGQPLTPENTVEEMVKSKDRKIESRRQHSPETSPRSRMPSFLSINMAPDVRATAKKKIIVRITPGAAKSVKFGTIGPYTG